MTLVVFINARLEELDFLEDLRHYFGRAADCVAIRLPEMVPRMSVALNQRDARHSRSCANVSN